ncbi:disulfide oxidoreductase [Bacillus cereus group sp. TH152-1LC]|uniref:disulfide oxidoreductase n=1 Tax=Bacillus cereus group sp. TH152-1LC TaxID=3018060 RepID=UPI0022E6AE53|nr:disulfide oxidoreductase [Bacillus cereus group sp. TH152-1LC]MDA1674874.1 disulfide oxidoreductase [Bacillus cereus group sp. TH152-1LC]
MNHIRISWLVALVATLGSLFFSEIMHFIPCTLCWYQRILMYPLVIFLGVAMIRNNEDVPYYVLPMSILGMIISGYHYSIQKIISMPKLTTCTTGTPCTGQYVNWLDFITIPFLAFVAFTIITVSLVLLVRKQKKSHEN